MDVKLIKVRRNRNQHVSGFVLQASRHLLMLVLFLILLVGMIAGNFYVKSNEQTYSAVSDIFKNYISTISGQTFIRTFLTQLTVNFTVILLMFVFGLCSIGFPVPVISIIIKGISIGALSAFMYSEYELKGFGFCMLVFYPVQIINSLVLLRAGKESFTMSGSIFRILNERKQNNAQDSNPKKYTMVYIVLGVITIVASLLSAVLSFYIVPLLKF